VARGETMSQQDEQPPRVVIRDKRRIDPTSGAARVPAEQEPISARPAQRDQRETVPEQGEQMSEQFSETPADLVEEPAGGVVVDDATRQLAERTEDLQRVTAEYANYRRRVERDRVLVVDQARDHGDLTGAFKVVADRVLGLLEGLGVAAFGAPGDPFDPSLHEAVLHDTSPEVSEPTATTVLRPGFRRGDRVLRTAMVGVTDPESPAPAAAGSAGTDATADDTADEQPGADPAVG
jgi:molecular chaperone GrpE